MWSLRRQDGGDTDAGMEVLLEQAAEQQRMQQTYDNEIARGSSIGGIGGLMANIRDLTFGDDFGAGSLRAGMANSPVVPPDIGDIEGMLGGEERAFDIPIEAEIGMAVIPGGGKGKGIGGITDLFKSMGKSLDPEDGRTLDKLSNQPKTPPTSTDPYEYKDKFQSLLDKTFPGSKKAKDDLMGVSIKRPPTYNTAIGKERRIDTPYEHPSDTLRHRQKYVEGELGQDTLGRKKRKKLDRELINIKQRRRASDPELMKKEGRPPGMGATNQPGKFAGLGKRSLDSLRQQQKAIEKHLREGRWERGQKESLMQDLADIKRQINALDPPLMAAGGRPMYKKGYYGKSYK